MIGRKYAKEMCSSAQISSLWGFQGGLVVKNLPANAGDAGSIPRLGRSPGEGKGNPLQYFWLENPMDRGAWRAAVHGDEKSQTQLSNWAWMCCVFHILNRFFIIILKFYSFIFAALGLCCGPRASLVVALRLSSHAAAAAKSLQSCLTLCDPIDGSPQGSSIPGILQARILEWAAISFSNACTHAKSLQSCPTLCDPMESSPSGSPVHGIL